MLSLLKSDATQYFTLGFAIGALILLVQGDNGALHMLLSQTGIA